MAARQPRQRNIHMSNCDPSTPLEKLLGWGAVYEYSSHNLPFQFTKQFRDFAQRLNVSPIYTNFIADILDNIEFEMQTQNVSQPLAFELASDGVALLISLCSKEIISDRIIKRATARIKPEELTIVTAKESIYPRNSLQLLVEFNFGDPHKICVKLIHVSGTIQPPAAPSSLMRKAS